MWTVRTWEITENSIGYQGPYVALGAYFMSAAAACSVNSDCHDGFYCNGTETCDNRSCVPGTNPCTVGSSCDESTDTCVANVCNNNGVCEPEEDCNNCPNDCLSGRGGGCSNGVCEPGLGEDCLSCAIDCRGKQGGSPRNRYCCGDGDGSNPVSCGDGSPQSPEGDGSVCDGNY